jgi:hypothetical protein
MGIPEKVLSLNSKREIIYGSTSRLNEKIISGADLRICTGFLHNEHIDISSCDDQLINETSTFAQTVMIDERWSAYFMTLRQPVALREGFGSPNALSLFLYNQDGQQAMARLVMDGSIDKTHTRGSEEAGMKKSHTQCVNDEGTPGVSRNFVYDFEFFDFYADDRYEELYSNDEKGICLSGSIDQLEEAYRTGRGIKISFTGLLSSMWENTDHRDEVFIHCGSSYYYTKDKLMITNTLPFISLPVSIPLLYRSRSFRYCWMVARTDGHVQVRSFDPFKNDWETVTYKLPVRWFAKR